MFPTLAQRDPKWASVVLGFNPPGSAYTIGTDGCLLVSMAMLCNQPDVLAFHNCRRLHNDFTPGTGIASTFHVSDCAPAVKMLSVIQTPGDIPPAVLTELYAHLKTQPAILEVDGNLTRAGLQQHFVLAVGLDSAGHIVIHDPWDGKEELLVPRYGPTDSRAIWRIITYEVPSDPKGASPMKATVNNPIAGANRARVFDGPATTAKLICALPNGFQGEFDPQVDGWAHVALTCGGKPMLDDNLAVITGHINGNNNLIWDLPSPNFTINPSVGPVTQVFTLSWKVSDVNGVWLLKPDKVLYPTVGTAPDGSAHVETYAAPAAGTFDFTLRVLYRTGQYVDYKKSITAQVVVEPPVPPLPPATKPVLGVNNVKDGNSGRAVIDAGAQGISTTFNPHWGGEIKQAHPALKVAVRGLLNGGYTPTIEEWWNKVYEGAVNGMDMIGLNENDHGVGTSPDDIRRRIDFDRQALARTKQEAANRGIVLNYVGGGFSAGTPNIRDKEVIKAMSGYAVLMADPHFKFNQHLYSTGDGTPGQTPEMIRDLVFSDAYSDETMDRYNPATGTFSQVPQRVMAYDWTIRRWVFYYTLCGWSPTAPGRIVADEAGMDVGSRGGFVGMGCDGVFMQRWAPRFVQVQGQPIVINGISYPSPVEWCMLFQSGDMDRWASYEVRTLLSGLQACHWGQA